MKSVAAQQLASLYHIWKANVVDETYPTSKAESRVHQAAFIKSGTGGEVVSEEPILLFLPANDKSRNPDAHPWWIYILTDAVE